MPCEHCDEITHQVHDGPVFSWRCTKCCALRRPPYDSGGHDDMTPEEYREVLIAGVGPERYFSDYATHNLVDVTAGLYRQLLRAEKELRRYNIQVPRDSDRVQAEISKRMFDWCREQTGKPWPKDGES